jgi:hypothetical protein
VGTFGGKSHAQGGTRGVFEDGTQIEVEAGENFYVLNKNASRHIGALSKINTNFGGIPLMAAGGSVSFSGNVSAANLTNDLDRQFQQQNHFMNLIKMLPAPVVAVQDINYAQGQQATIESNATW